MDYLIIINDGPYGTEKAYNALRLAMSLQREYADVQVRVFLMADSVHCALPGQVTPRWILQHRKDAQGSVGEGW